LATGLQFGDGADSALAIGALNAIAIAMAGQNKKALPKKAKRLREFMWQTSVAADVPVLKARERHTREARHWGKRHRVWSGGVKARINKEPKSHEYLRILARNSAN
jgi:hypothetical protein